jgi:hypothetical protein
MRAMKQCGLIYDVKRKKRLLMIHQNFLKRLYAHQILLLILLLKTFPSEIPKSSSAKASVFIVHAIPSHSIPQDGHDGPTKFCPIFQRHDIMPMQIIESLDSEGQG